MEIETFLKLYSSRMGEIQDCLYSHWGIYSEPPGKIKQL